jgi:hypothetical protein
MLLTETETSFARPVVRGARELCSPGNMMCGFQNVVERQRTRLSLSLSRPLRWALHFRRRRLTCSRPLKMTNDLLKSQHERMDKAEGVQTSLSRLKCLRRWRLTRQASATRPSQITLPSDAKNSDFRWLCDPRSREVCLDPFDFQRRWLTGVSTVNSQLTQTA